MRPVIGASSTTGSSALDCVGTVGAARARQVTAIRPRRLDDEVGRNMAITPGRGTALVRTQFPTIIARSGRRYGRMAATDRIRSIASLNQFSGDQTLGPQKADDLARQGPGVVH